MKTDALLILIPVFNEWDLLGTLLGAGSTRPSMKQSWWRTSCFLDDGSTIEHAGRLHLPELAAVDGVELCGWPAIWGISGPSRSAWPGPAKTAPAARSSSWTATAKTTRPTFPRS